MVTFSWILALTEMALYLINALYIFTIMTLSYNYFSLSQYYFL